MPRLRGSRTAVLAAAALIAAGGGALTTILPAQAAAPCQVDYAVNQWSGGFTAAIKLTVADAHSTWAVTWTYPGDQKVTSAWSAQATQSGKVVTARNMAWNGSLAAGGSVEFGVQGTYSAGNPAPTDFALDGVACNGSGTPSTAPTTPGQQPTTDPTTAPTTTPTGGPTQQPGGCSGATLCDGFENQAGGAPGGGWSVAYPNCSGNGTATVDTSTAHSGSKSIRINGAAGYCNHVFLKSSQALTGSVVFGRYYVRHTTALPAAHVTFMALRDDNDGGKDLRMGGQNNALQWNRESDDATLPEQSPAGVAQSRPLSTGQWNCVEFQVDGSQGRLRTWLNGTEVPGLQADGSPTNDIDRQWSSRANWRPALRDLRLGWESYGDGSDTLWFDDVAVGSSRIGC